jgi:hypothetical protein
MKKMYVMIILFCFPLLSYGINDNGFNENLITIEKKEFSDVKPVTPGAKSLDIYDFRDMLRDKDPEVRKMAIKSSLKYITNSDIHKEILNIYLNPNERMDIRIDAVKALSYVGNIYEVKDKIKDAIKYGDIPDVLKPISYKALWISGETFSDVRDFLVDRLKYDEKDIEIKKAIIWAMFSSSNNSRIYEILVDIIKYGPEPISLKIEAIKSLYLAMGNSTVYDLIYDIAKYHTSSSEKEMRKTAIFALSARNGDSRVKALLEDLIKYSDDKEIKEVALKAYSPNIFEVYDFFHLSYRTSSGALYNPIEKE